MNVERHGDFTGIPALLPRQERIPGGKLGIGGRFLLSVACPLSPENVAHRLMWPDSDPHSRTKPTRGWSANDPSQLSGGYKEHKLPHSSRQLVVSAAGRQQQKADQKSPASLLDGRGWV